MVIPRCCTFSDTGIWGVWVFVVTIGDGWFGWCGCEVAGGYRFKRWLLGHNLGFFFYSAVIFGFALMNPMGNALAAKFCWFFPFMEPEISFLGLCHYGGSAISKLGFTVVSRCFYWGLARSAETNRVFGVDIAWCLPHFFYCWRMYLVGFVG